MRGARLRWTAVLLAAAAVVAVTWIRLRPLGLHGLDDRAAAEVRDRLAGARHLDDAAVEAWIAEHPARFARKVASTRDRLAGTYTYRAEDGRDHVYLGDLDSYLWLRRARQYLRAGTTCDTVVQGDCRDLHTLAPVGGSMRYARSIHIAAIVAVHRIAAWLRPGWPLPSSAMLVPVIVGALGVLPAFALGRRLAGDAAGLCAAIVGGTNAVFLVRSIGGDDDVWNVVLPLAVVWAVSAALGARRQIACLGFAALAAGVQTVHALSWRGALVTWGVVVGALALDLAVSAARALAPRRRGSGNRRAPPHERDARRVLPRWPRARGVAGRGDDPDSPAAGRGDGAHRSRARGSAVRASTGRTRWRRSPSCRTPASRGSRTAWAERSSASSAGSACSCSCFRAGAGVRRTSPCSSRERSSIAGCWQRPR